MSSIPYNYGSYIDAKVAMTDTGHVSAGKQIQSPASAGSRGLAKTTQFTNDRTQMQMGNSPIAESMIEIRNIMNRIDGINVPTNEMNELADDEKMEFTKILLDISVIRDRIERLSVSDEAKQSALKSLKNAEEALVALDETAVQEDIGDKGRIALEKAGFDPMKVKEYMAVFNDHGDTSDIDQMNMDKVGLADAMAMVLASHDVENESTTEDSGELSRLKELSGLEEDDESYGYEWECSNCGTENEFVMTPQERAQYIKDWEADNQDLVANGETGENALNNLLDDTGEESGMHYGQKCMKCGTEAANPYQPMPEGDEFDIEEDEDFEEVLGSLGFPEDETELFDAEYQGRKVPLNKPMRGDSKKFKVYVKDPKTGNVKKVNFGHGGTSAKKAGQKTMKIRKSNPKARKSFRARHNCANPGPKTKARYWSCRKW